MIIGIGTDILEIKKLNYIFSQNNYQNDSFVRKTYTAKEIAQADERERPIFYYATRFAAKEAVFKAITENAQDCHLLEIEILADESGAPHVTLHGKAKLLAKKREIQNIQISLSFEDNYAVAFVIAES